MNSKQRVVVMIDDSPSGGDPRFAKPWKELTEVERMEYAQLVRVRAMARAHEAKMSMIAKQNEAVDCYSYTMGVVIVLVIAGILIKLFL